MLAEYVAAVQAGDRDGIAELCQPGVDAAANIASVVDRIGGRRWRDVGVSWHRGEFPGVARADIRAKDDAGLPIAETVILSKVDGRWWIGLGSAAARPSPASTRRPS